MDSECKKPEKRMNFRGIRSSKFRHVYGSQAKKEKCYENIKITRNAHDSNFCAVNPKFVAIVVEVGGGGSFVVVPIEKTGRAEHVARKVSGHSRPVSDIKWNPFDDNIIASGSEDCTIKIWHIPDGGLLTDLNDYLVELLGHRRRISMLEWHPTADNILLSSGYDHRIAVWNVARGEAVNFIDCHPDVIYSMSLNRNGSLLATTCKDKKLRIIDPRNGDVLRMGDSHQGTKASKVVYLGDSSRLFTTGFSKFSDRQYSVWSQNDLSQPLVTESIDCSSGVLFPFYDHDTKIVFLAGKGDGNVRYYELLDEAPWVFYLSQFISGAPQRGFGVLPKRGCDTSQCEIFRFYKLHATKDFVEPISMIVPRKGEFFQDDIYPDTAAHAPAISAEDWMSGKNSNPILMSMKTGKFINNVKGVGSKSLYNQTAIVDKNNDRKFMFLSEETKPDYRPVSQRTGSLGDQKIVGNLKQNSSPQQMHLDPKTTTSGHLAPSKFQEVHKKWSTGTQPQLDLDSDDHLENIYRKKVTSGATTVKNLTNRFSKFGVTSENGHQNKNEDTLSLRQTVNDQRKEIDTLKAQVLSKDLKIRQLEDELIVMRRATNGKLIGENGIHVSESVA